MQHGVMAGAAGDLVQSSRLTSLAVDPDQRAGPVPALAPVSYPAASAACRDLGVNQGRAACRDSVACQDSAAVADSGGRVSVESPAAGVVATGADVAAELDAQLAAWAAVVAADAAASADASSNRGAHTKDDPHNSVPNSRRD
jgi:hypothetical protein